MASLAMISGAVAVERRGRAFASIYAAELAGMAVGPLIGSIVGVHHMWAMFLASGIVAFRGLHPRGSASPNRRRSAATRPDPDGPPDRPIAPIVWRRPMTGALIAAAALGLTTGVYDICWTLLLVSRGAAGWQIGISWTMFAVPFVLAAKPSGWLADHMDRRGPGARRPRSGRMLLRLVPVHPRASRHSSRSARSRRSGSPPPCPRCSRC